MSDPIQYEIAMPEWNCFLTVLMAPDGIYYVIREMCGVLGISKVTDMIARMNDHPVIQPHVKKQWYKTRGGRQQGWCLHRRALAFWLGTINPKGTRPEVYARLIWFQERLLDLSDQLLFGVVDEAKPNNIIRLQDYFGTLPAPSNTEDDDT